MDDGDGGWKLVGRETVAYKENNSDFNKFDFSGLIHNITFDKVGSYVFRMTEVIGSLENVDYDKTVNTFVIKVTDDDMDGWLELNSVTGSHNATVTEDGDRFAVSVTFNNTFIPPVITDPDGIEVSITVNKTVKNTGEIKIGPGGFEFVLENTGNKEKLAILSDDAGMAVFTLPFTAADIGKTYTYKLYETNDGVAGGYLRYRRLRDISGDHSRG